MKQLLTTIIVFLFVQTTIAYNPYWTLLDKILIRNIVQLDKNNPQAIEGYFKTNKCKIVKENLGFGWKMWEQGIGGGYISIKARFIYYNDSIVSYYIIPQIPEEKELINRYKKWYQNSFTFEKDNIQAFAYKEEGILKPLKEYIGTLSSKTVPRKILDYMTPNSGTIYGYSGGYSSTILQNRKAFFEIKDSLTTDQVTLLMYSINPASRFTAFEYYLRHGERFTNQQILDEWMEINFAETPEIRTLLGCLVKTMDTRTMVHIYSTMESEKEK